MHAPKSFISATKFDCIHPSIILRFFTILIVVFFYNYWASKFQILIVGVSIMLDFWWASYCANRTYCIENQSTQSWIFIGIFSIFKHIWFQYTVSVLTVFNGNKWLIWLSHSIIKFLHLWWLLSNTLFPKFLAMFDSSFVLFVSKECIRPIQANIFSSFYPIFSIEI